jgi:vancomycin resistance protein YoaR
MDHADQIPASPRPRRRWAWAMVFGALLAFGSAGAGYVLAFSGKLAPHTSVGGLHVGGDDQMQAAADVNAREQVFLNTPLVLSYGSKTWRVKPSQLGLSFSNDDAIEEAYEYDRTGSLPQEFGHLLLASVKRRSYAPDLFPVTIAGKSYLEKNVLASIETPPAETTLNFIPGNVTVVRGVPGKLLDYESFDVALAAAYGNGATTIPLVLATFQPTVSAADAEVARAQASALLSAPFTVKAGSITLTLQPSELAGILTTAPLLDGSGLRLILKPVTTQALLASWSTKINQPATNVQVQESSGQLAIAQVGKDGSTLDVTAAQQQLAALAADQTLPAGRTITLSVQDVAAPVNPQNLASLGIVQLIGTATTSLGGSPGSRLFNIALGQKTLNGILVQPGDTFSTIGALGPVDEAHGYEDGLSIIGNRTIPEPGGGLCQVSTTLFRAVLNAGLPVVERVAHSYRVEYYEVGVGPGLDATIYEPGPDFKWKNDTGHAILIQSHIADGNITFDLYGTSDGRVSSVPTPTILSQTPAPAPIYTDTNTLPKGATQQIEISHPGAVTTVTYTVTRNGSVINQQTFKSDYQPWPAQYLVGTA